MCHVMSAEAGRRPRLFSLGRRTVTGHCGQSLPFLHVFLSLGHYGSCCMHCRVCIQVLALLGIKTQYWVSSSDTECPILVLSVH